MTSLTSGNDPAGVSDALEFAETLASAADEVTEYRQRRALILYLGLDGGEAWTLQAIADVSRVSREAVRQRRDRAVERLVYRALPDGADGICVALGEQARRLAKRFGNDLVGLLEAFEAGSGTKRARDWVVVALRLAGRHPRTATKLAGEACRRQRAALLAVETDRHAAARESRAIQRQAAALAQFLDQAAWPSTVRDDWQPGAFTPQRAVRAGLGRTGSFHSRKLGRAVQYESGLELAFLNRLERSDRVVGYQEQPISIDYVVGGRPRKYVPDVVAVFDDGRALVIEIKPRLQMALMTNIRKWVALARWCGQHGSGLLIGDGRVSVSTMLLDGCDHEFRAELLHAIRNGPLTYNEYRDGVGRGRTVNELAAAIGYGLLAWQLSPFVLRLPAADEKRDARAFTNLLREQHRQRPRPGDPTLSEVEPEGRRSRPGPGRLPR
jgi:hypothetical protein